MSLNIIIKTSNAPSDCEHAAEDYSLNLSLLCETLINVYQVKPLHIELILTNFYNNQWVSIVSSSSWSFYYSKIKAFQIFTGTVPVVKECVLTLKRYLRQRWRSGILNSLNLIIFLGQFDPQDVYRNSSHSGLGTNSVMGRGCAVTLKHLCPIIHQFL